MNPTTLHYFDRYLARYQSYKPYWNYEDGCILAGCRQLYEATGDKAYREFVLNYLNPRIAPDGTIRSFEADKHNIDSFNAGNALFFALDQTGEQRFRDALRFLMAQLAQQPRTRDGSFWHKDIYPDQVWLDGLYMAQPFYMEYDTRYQQRAHYDDILRQFRNARKTMFCARTGLYFHGYDAARLRPWANPQTGTSKSFWLRAMGWYLMALVDVIGAMSAEISDQYREYGDLFREAMCGILKYRDTQTGLFYQVIDQGGADGNYTETSGSAMIAYALLKACRLGVVSSAPYLQTGLALLRAVETEKLRTVNGHIRLCDICCVAGLGPGEARDGSAAYYLSEKVVCDDPKGVGPFMMACAQAELLRHKQNGTARGVK